jgi:hypothetical protein
VKPHCLLFLLLALVALVPAPALAWTQLGHQLVGDLAASRLAPRARAEIAQLLAGEADPTLGGVASWADALRDSDPPRFKATSDWHFIDSRNGSCAFVLPRDCPDGNCVIAAIEAQRKVLADRNQSLAARRDALKFLVHFVGDLHQPLHASNHADAGGNQFQVSLRTDLAPQTYARSSYSNGVMGTNLHAIWDYYVLASARLTARQYVLKLQPRLPKPLAGGGGAPLAWARESCDLIDALKLYPRKHTMDHAYLTSMRPLAERRIELAALRLAALLNATLGGA